MAGEDLDYADRVRELPCCYPGADACDGAIEAHHAGDRFAEGDLKSSDRRAHDWTCIPLCRKHHRAWHDVRGHYANMTRDDRREWARDWIARTRLEIGPRRPPVVLGHRIRIAVDVQVGGRSCAALDAAGFDVVVRALPGEPDHSWFNRAIDERAELAVSPDRDIERLCHQSDALVGIQWVRLWPGDGWRRQVDRVTAARGRALRSR